MNAARALSTTPLPLAPAASATTPSPLVPVPLDADPDAVSLPEDVAVLKALVRELLEAEYPKLLPKSLLGQPVAYALRHWQALLRYAGDGFLDIDNNVAERALRHIAIGRKNWLFAGSAKGAATAATLFTVTSSCHRHGVDVFAYLHHDLLERLACAPEPDEQRLRDWLPDRWRPPAPNTS